MSSVDLAKDALVVLPAPISRTVLLYVVHGEVIVHGEVATLGDVVSFANDGDCLSLESSAGARLIYAHARLSVSP